MDTYTVLKVLPNTVTSYTDSTYLTQRYYYRVYAKNATGIGPSSVAYVPFVATGLFEKTVGGTGNDFAYSVIEVDGGYVVAGETESFGAGSYDFYMRFDF